MKVEAGTKQRDEVKGELVERSAELQVGAIAPAKEQEIRAMVMIAKRFPRDEEAAFRALLTAAERPSFAEEAAYSFPRGGATVTGPSIVLAREAGRLWGNIKSGVAILRDDEESRLIEAYAWDMQTNAYATGQDDFKKVIYRKDRGWIVPDERDLRELTNRRGAILVRNCILSLLPKDRIDQVLAQSLATVQGGASKDLPATRLKALQAFFDLSVTQAMLEQKLGHPFAETTAAELAQLRGIYKSILDGNSKWADYVTTAAPADEEKDAHDAERLKAGQAALAGEKERVPAPEPVSDVRWQAIIDYLDSDLARQQVKKKVKATLKMDGLHAVVDPHRTAFIHSVLDFAKRAKVAMELP